MIFYASRTGNVRSIVEALCLPATDIKGDMKPLGPFILFTYTDGLGDVPQIVKSFMNEHHVLCKGVIVSGNRNFGELFCAAGDKIAQQYNIPVVAKYDLRGPESNDELVQAFYERAIL